MVRLRANETLAQQGLRGASSRAGDHVWCLPFNGSLKRWKSRRRSSSAATRTNDHLPRDLGECSRCSPTGRAKVETNADQGTRSS